MRLNLGCNDRQFPDYVNVDRVAPADVLTDLEKAWPWEDSSVEHILAHDVIEHLHDKIHTMNEAHRVLAPEGTIEIAVPTTDGPGAFQDPTHVSYWNRRSFMYYEAGNYAHTRLAKSYGITAAFRIVSERLDDTMDGPRLTIMLAAVKAGRRLGELDDVALAGLLADPLKLLGAMRVKNESEWIRESIESQLAICDKVLVFDDHSTDDTKDIVRSFGERCILMESPFSGLDEARDKNYILEHLVIARPEWVLWIDGDEVLERNAPTVLRTILDDPTVCAGTLPFAFFWNDREHVRTDGVYAGFQRTTLFRVRDQDTVALRFAATGAGPNFHCGTYPQGLRGNYVVLDTRIKHYGYLTPELRQAKFEWYNKIDPNNEKEDCYRHVIETPGAIHAPGPTVLVPWVEK
jgi:SAM-dependent methyltransferase